MFVDSHCHLDKLDYQDLHTDVSDVLAKAHQAKVEYLLSVGVTLDSFPKMLAMIEPFSQVYASCGVHPLDVQSDFSLDLFHQYAQHPRVVAIGETGWIIITNLKPPIYKNCVFGSRLRLQWL